MEETGADILVVDAVIRVGTDRQANDHQTERGDSTVDHKELFKI